MRNDSKQGQTVSESKHRATSSQTVDASSSAASGELSANRNENENPAQLSGTHVLVQTLAAEVAQLPEVRQEKVRQEKVRALRQAVQRGDYNPVPEQVAEALVSHLGVNRPDAMGETGWRASQEWAMAI